MDIQNRKRNKFEGEDDEWSLLLLLLLLCVPVCVSDGGHHILGTH